MASVPPDDQPDPRSFEKAAETQANRAFIKIYFMEGLRAFLKLLAYFLITVLRFVLAVIGAIACGWLVAVSVAVVVFGFWAWSTRGMKSGFGALLDGMASTPTEDERIQAEATREKLLQARPYSKPAAYLMLITPLILSVFAGIGVAHLFTTPIGIVAGIVFFTVSVLSPFFMKRTLKRFFEIIKLMSPGPKNTPET